MTNYRIHALMTRIPYDSPGRARPTGRPGKHRDPDRSGGSRRPAVRDVVFGILLVLSLAAGLSARRGEVPPGPSILALVHDLEVGDSALKRAAAARLGEMGPAAAKSVPSLRAALDDPEVCYGALQALKRILRGEPDAGVRAH